MHKKVLVCLPLSDAHRAALEASVPEFEFRFNALDDVHAEDVLWADVVLGNAPVSMLSQNKHIEWFQSNSAGPDPYLKPGVLPEDCVVTNATGAYGLAISEWMLAMWLGIQKDMFLYRDRQNQRRWAPIDRPVRGITGARVLCVGMGDIGSNFARRAHMLGAEVVGVRRTVHPDTPCPDYCTRVVAQSELDEELPEADLIALSLPDTAETYGICSTPGGLRAARTAPFCSTWDAAPPWTATPWWRRCTAARSPVQASTSPTPSRCRRPPPVGRTGRHHHPPQLRRLQPAQDAGQHRGHLHP